MFVRVRGTEPRRYLQIVKNRREGKQTRQRGLCTLGRVIDRCRQYRCPVAIARALGDK